MLSKQCLYPFKTNYFFLATGEIDSQMTIKFLNSMIADLQHELETKEEQIQSLQSGEFSDPTR